jgi:hypothetical protein
MFHSLCRAVIVGLLVSVSAECVGEEPKQPRSLATLVGDLRSTNSDLRQSAIKALYDPVHLLPIKDWLSDDLEDAREFREQANPLLADLINCLVITTKTWLKRL